MTKFLIVSCGRSGTNMFRSLLNEHPRVYCYSELFQPGAKQYEVVYAYPKGREQPTVEALQKLVDTNPELYLTRYVYEVPEDERNVRGFKIFYDQPPGPDHDRVWRCLAEFPDLRVIHLWRRNQLDRFISVAQAHQTDTWTSDIPSAIPPPAVDISVPKFLGDLAHIIARREEKMAMFANHPRLNLEYEDLARDQAGQMRRVFEFLGIDPLPVKARTHRASRGGLRSSLRNFSEVQDALRDTPHAHFIGGAIDGAQEKVALTPHPVPQRPVRFRLFSHVCAVDLDIFGAFLDHYSKLGIDSFHLVIHGPENECRAMRKACRRYPVVIEREYDRPFDETVKCSMLTDHIRKFKGEWALLADIDEFLELPCPSLESTIRLLRLCGARSLPAVLVQRIAAEGAMATLAPGQNPQQVYPLCSVLLTERMNPDMPPWKSKYPLFYIDDDTMIRRGHHLPPDGYPSHALPLRAAVHHFKWRASFFESIEARLKMPNANAHELLPCKRWLDEHDNRLPIEGSFRNDRADLFRRGLLRFPDRGERRHAALVNRIRIGRQLKDKELVVRRLARHVSGLDQVCRPAPGAALDPAYARLSPADLAGRPGRIAFVTFQLAPPDRSAGIGTAVATLVDTLVRAGHAVSVLYVKPVEDSWQEIWGGHGVELAGLKFDGDNPYAGLTPNLGYRALEWLHKGGFDIIHFHDAIGLGAMATAAKRQLLMFANTALVVTNHGNTAWHNRGNDYPLTFNELRLVAAEQEQLAGADLAVAPSFYQYRWLEEQGCAVPRSRYVIPNILSGEFRLSPRAIDRQPRRIDEFVLFGRIEHRKGLDLFCDAIDGLCRMGRTGFNATFLGSQGNPGVADFIHQRAKAWSVPWRFIEGFGIGNALQYFHDNNAVAIMPSRLDNYPYTVLECLGNGIPFIATDIGGTAEMISPDDRARVLIKPDGDELCRAMARILDEGHAPAHASCDLNAVELGWIAWHGMILNHPPPPPPLVLPPAGEMADTRVTVCMVEIQAHQPVVGAIESMVRQRGAPFDVLVSERLKSVLEAGLCNRATTLPAFIDQVVWTECGMKKFRAVPCEKRGFSATANHLAANAATEFLIVSRLDVTADQQLVRVMLQTAVAERADAVVAGCEVAVGTTSLWETPDKVFGLLHASVSPLALAPFENLYGAPCFLVRHDTFDRIGGFRDIPALAGVEQWDLLNRVALSGGRIAAAPFPLCRHYVTLSNYMTTLVPSRAAADALVEPFRSTVQPGLAPLLTIVKEMAGDQPDERRAMAAAIARWEEEQSLSATFKGCDPLLSMKLPRDLMNLKPEKEVALTPLADGIEALASGHDPNLFCPPLAFAPGGQALHVLLDIECEHPVLVQLFWKTRARPDYCEAQSARFNSRPGFNRVHFTTPKIDVVNPLRIDPGTLPGSYIIRRLEVWGQK